jgi:ribulose-phosphate 3-epimerase
MKNPGKRIAPSILSADFARLGEEIAAVQVAGADWIHVDVMDGHFVPNITIGPLVVEAAKRVSTVPLDVHLMIEKPERYVDAFIRAGAAWLTVHVEACVHLDRILASIREKGAKAGVSLNPATPVAALEYILDKVDLVLVMSVNPGFGGQRFIAASLDKIRALVNLREERRLNFWIEVDGGINLDTIAAVSKAGADVFVAGSAIFGSADYAQTLRALKQLL